MPTEINDVTNTEEKCFAYSRTAVTPQLLKKVRWVAQRKIVVLFSVALVLCAVLTVALICSGEKSGRTLVAIPAFMAVILAIVLVRVLTASKSQEKKSLQMYPNYVYEYLFYCDRVTVTGKSDTSNTEFTVKYADIKRTLQDDDYAYVFYENMVLPIEKSNITEYADIVLKKLKATGESPAEYGKSGMGVRALLLTMFVLSLLTIFIAVFAVMICIKTSPLPDFGFNMTEYMWIFLVFIPLPLASAILGIVFIKKGYKCKKNIVAGFIMCALLAVYGCFTFAFRDTVGHDFDNYTAALEATVNINLPDNGYVSYQTNTYADTNGMIKFDNADEILQIVQSDKRFTRSVPSSIVSSYHVTRTANYDYFLLYDATCYEYADFSGDHEGHRFIYLAYNADTNVLYVVDFTK